MLKNCEHQIHQCLKICIGWKIAQSIRHLVGDVI